MRNKLRQRESTMRLRGRPVSNRICRSLPADGKAQPYFVSAKNRTNLKQGI